MWNDLRVCENKRCKFGVEGAPKVFKPKRRWQVFCCTRCRQARNNRRLYRVPLPRAQRQRNASNTHLSTRRPWSVAASLVEGAGVFSHIAGRPRNFAGELTRIALANPRFILKLTAHSSQPTDRPTCRTCELDCADGVECVKLAVPQMAQIAQIKGVAA